MNVPVDFSAAERDYLGDSSWWRERLDVRAEGDRSADDFYADCPVCGGKLHVTQGDGKVLTHCFHTECDHAEIVAAIDEEEEEPVAIRRVPTKQGAAAAWGDYADAKQLDLDALVPLIGKVKRSDPVRFHFEGGYRERMADDGHYEWRGGLKAKRHPLWPLPADELPETIYLTEGETDALTLRIAGYEAYTITTGAQPKPVLTPSRYLALMRRGVTEIVLCPDADETGQAWFDAEADAARSAGFAVSVLDWTPHYDPFDVQPVKDSNDLWRRCKTAKAFRKLVEEHTHQRHKAKPFFVSHADALETAHEDVDYVVQDLIAAGDKVMVAGPPKALKTWTVLDLVRALTQGDKFLHRDEWSVPSPKRVAFVEEEGSPQLFFRRVELLGIDTDSDAVVWAHRRGFRFTEPAAVERLIGELRAHGTDVVIFDPLQRMIPGVDENGAAETGVVWDAVARMHEALPHLVVIVIHHTNKDGGLSWNAIRGSSRHAGEVDLGLFLDKGDDHTLKLGLDGRDIPQFLDRGEAIEIEYTINRETRTFHMQATGAKIKVGNAGRRAEASQSKILDAVAGGLETKEQIADAVGLSLDQTGVHLRKLEEEGRLASKTGPRNQKRYMRQGEAS